MSGDFSDDRDDLDRLLDGRADDVRSPRLWRLARLLRAAAAPARPHELRGESDALEAFRAARHRPARARRAGFGLSAVKVAAIFLAVTMGSAGVVAVGLVRPVLDSAPETPPQVSAGASSTSGERREESPSFSPAPAPTRPTTPGTSLPAGDGPAPSGSPDGDAPSATELCGSYLALDESERQEALERPAFAPLISLAEPRSVHGYCDDLLGTSSPSTSPSPSAPSPSAPSPSSPPSASPSPSGPSPSVEDWAAPARKAPGSHPPERKSIDSRKERPSVSTSAQRHKIAFAAGPVDSSEVKGLKKR